MSQRSCFVPNKKLTAKLAAEGAGHRPYRSSRCEHAKKTFTLACIEHVVGQGPELRHGNQADDRRPHVKGVEDRTEIVKGDKEPENNDIGDNEGCEPRITCESESLEV